MPGGIYGHSGGSGISGGSAAAGVPAVTNTHVTYNNYYNNGSDSAAPNPAPVEGNVNPQMAAPVQGAPQNPPPGGAPQGPPPNQPPQGQPPQNVEQSMPSPSGHIVTNDELGRLTEDLYNKDSNNAYPHMSMNLQGQKKDDSATDDAPEA